ncbi:MAG: hotdog domain-containing protein, partial [Planktomarina sp.]|nr:hotdog domain-containing protein [Planktomarina sp.]
ESFHLTGGVPTATIATKFTAPSRHGDKLVLSLEIGRIGRSSFSYLMTAHCLEEQRFSTEATLVHTNQIGKPTPIPEEIRKRLTKFIKVNS